MSQKPPKQDEPEPRQAVLVPPDAPVVPVPAGREVERADALTRYMAELRHHAPISREEEHELALRWVEGGDVTAARQLVLANLRLVVKIAMEYRRAWTNTRDLIQEGNVGLLQAVTRFDPYQGVKLSSYAVYWIRAYILKYILDNMRSVRMGTTRAQRKLFFRLNKERRELERQGFEVTPRLLAERLEVTEDDVIEMQARLAQPDQSTDAPLRQDESGGATYGDFLTGGEPSAEDAVGREQLHRVFQDQIGSFREELADRDRQILDERVLAEEPRTLQEMGDEFGVSRERVRQLEARLVERLREYMKERLVDFEYYAPGRE
ncbi:MAG: RNA polymerase factor sigma-32 [Proteobacteria bacterium]|nr:RNA polymerase factor sigma-32 [Pseudomonadota bacterium]